MQWQIQNEGFHIEASGELDLFYIKGLTRLYSGTPSKKEAIHGHINSHELRLAGGLQFHNGIVEMGGNMKLYMNNQGVLSFTGDLQFNSGPFALFGANANIQILKSNQELHISGTTNTGLDLIPSILGFQSGASLDIRLNEQNKQVVRHKLSGTSYLLGHYAAASLDFHQNSIHYDGHFAIDLGILRLSAGCSGYIGNHHFQLNGRTSFSLGIPNTNISINISEHDFTIDERGFRLKYTDTFHGLCIGVRPWRATCHFQDFHRHNSEWANHEQMSLLIGYNARAINGRYLIAYRLDGRGHMFWPDWKSWGDDVNTNWPHDLRPFP